MESEPIHIANRFIKDNFKEFFNSEIGKEGFKLVTEEFYSMQ